jgi:NAD-dependent deacetylase
LTHPTIPPLPPELCERLGSVRSVGAITGAGVSSESGIRTYRGRGGIYDDPLEGRRTVEALSGHTLLVDPDRTWRTLANLAAQARDARPNPAHHALAEIERAVERFVLLTQNVDGLHRLAGCRNAIEIHGDLREARCLSCGRPRRFEIAEIAALDAAPACDRCGGLLRPDAVLFGEPLPVDKLRRIHEEFCESPPDLVLIAGTSALFPYIAGPFELAHRAGSLTVEVNPEATALSPIADYSLRGRAGALLPAIARALARSLSA